MESAGGRQLSAITRLPTHLAREELVALVWAVAGPLRLPLRCWPMQAALEVLDDRTPSAGRVRRALDEWAPTVTSHGRGRGSMDRLLRSLAIAGALSVAGKGWEAGYTPSPAWLGRAVITLASLTIPERAAVENSAQVLIAFATIWSKNSCTGLSDMSPTTS
jgi:hypothetical protein